ncbi:MAG: hypothetical protein DWQ35_01120 [Planctomycetota bacterium]|nr:MAG: hypothetical protein DWQ35_01120 [Planctomycetota bacterium]
MIAKAYLLAVALLYFALAIWCSMSPATTSEKVGFSLKGGTGKSEFLTVYGGLEFGIALVLASACLRDTTVDFGVLACVLLHGSLVAFRTISFFRFEDIGGFTLRLAIGEWLITVLGIAVLLYARLKS